MIEIVKVGNPHEDVKVEDVMTHIDAALRKAWQESVEGDEWFEEPEEIRKEIKKLKNTV